MVFFGRRNARTDEVLLQKRKDHFWDGHELVGGEELEGLLYRQNPYPWRGSVVKPLKAYKLDGWLLSQEGLEL